LVTIEIACENNDDRIDSDSDTIENIVEKGMVVAVLAYCPNYEYYLQKLTTGTETIVHRFSDNWVGIFDHGSKIVRALYYDRTQSNKPFLFKLIPWKMAVICFICAELERGNITVQEDLHPDILQSLYIHVFNK